MTKEGLIDILKYAYAREEEAIPIYLNHLKTAILWTGLDEKRSKAIRDVFQKLMEDTKRHRTTVGNILKKLEQGA